MDKPTNHGFDLSKLEALKDKSNKNFFQDMDKIKTGKTTGTKKQIDDGDLLNMGTEYTQLQKTSPIKIEHNLNEEFFEIGFIGQSSKKPKQEENLMDIGHILGNSEDIFNKPMIEPSKSIQQKSTGVDFTFDFIGPTNSSIVPSKQIDNLISFGKPEPVKTIDIFEHPATDLLLDKKSDKKEIQKSAPSDPFNFIVF